MLHECVIQNPTEYIKIEVLQNLSIFLNLNV